MRRRFLCAAALALLAAACRSGKPRAVSVDPALDALVPRDTVFLAGIDAEGSRGTRFYQRYLSDASVPELTEFVQKTGADPRRDIAELLVASNGKQRLVFVKGKFGKASPGGSHFEYKGHSLLGDQRSAVMFVNASTAIAGNAADLRAWIDRGDTASRGLPAALKQQIASIDGNRQVWAAFAGGVSSMEIPAKSNLGSLVANFHGLDQGTFGLDVRNGIDFRSDLQCRSEPDARRVHDAVRAVAGIGRVSFRDPEIQSLYNAIDVKQDGPRVVITAKIPAASEDKFLDLWLKHK